MFAKFITSALILLAAASSVSAHAAFAPVLGVAGTPARSDVQRPKTNAPCGKTDVATAMASSTAAPLAADGSFTVTATNFNPGRDGSRAVKTALVDTTGTGQSFAGTATVTTNGDGRPKTDGSDTLTIQMPAGTTCTGGADGASCLVSLTSTGGFGNCVVVSSAASSGAAAGNATGAATGATGATDATAGTGSTAGAATGSAGDAATTTANGKAGEKNKGVGSVAARAAAIAKAQRK